jgi:outer membrane autotransporter protein
MRSSLKKSVLLALAGFTVFGLAGNAYAWDESGTDDPKVYADYRFATGAGTTYHFTFPSIEMTAPNTSGHYSTPVPVWVTDGTQLYLEATTGNVTVGKPLTDGGCYWGAYVDSRGTNSVPTKLTIDANQDVVVMGEGYHHFGISAYSNSETKVIAGRNTELYGGYTTLYARDEENTGNTILSVTAEENNNIYASETASVNYGANCVSANDGAEIQIEAKNGDNNFVATGSHYMLSAIDANIINSDPVKQSLVEVTADKGSNHVSHPFIGMRADNWSKIDFTAYQDNTVTTTLPSSTIGIDSKGSGAEIELTAQHGNNEVTADYAVLGQTGGKVTFDAPEGTTTLTGTTAGILSSAGGTVTVNDASEISGSTVLQAESYQQDDTGANVGDPASITVNYAGDSKITGDIIMAYNNGKITIAPSEDSATETIVSDVLAFGTNDAAVDYVGGTVDIQLTNGSTFTGASAVANDLAADKGSTREGTINLDLPAGSLWYMTDSSSVTNLTGNGGTVYFQNGGYSLQIGTLTGSHTFAMDLSMDGTQSDMLYINEGTSDEQTLQIKNLSELDSEMQAGDAVRFAVVGNSLDEFRDGKVISVSTSGLYRNALSIEYRDVATDPLNTEAYNDEYNGDGTLKPTTADVNALYVDPYTDPQNVYVVKTAEALNDGTVTPERNRDLIWRYMTTLDTFTKRDGQSLYFTDEGDRGGWVRLGYSNLGIDGVGELDGNTYELGWTTISRQNDERKHRFSASVAYGKPKGHFEGYGGDLTVRDFSVNLYDTHEYYPSAEELANKPEWKKKSHAYWDNYLKYHHVKTEYDAYDHVVGTKYSGDYDQNVWNLSTEYGHKLMMNEDWFWVPQAQLQLSYLGSYDYVDSQGLHVDGDHDWSLIGRLGFDLVRDIHDSRDSKIYFKASLLHEFLDGNDVTVRYDSDRYVNEGDQSGTWGVVGLGYSSKIGDKQYFYLDAERYFGNDFDRTYDIRAGVNWKF